MTPAIPTLPRPTPEELARYVAALAPLVGLDLDPAMRLSVAQQLAGQLAAAAAVLEFPIPESLEAAPRFEP
jgi:Protein of unknown function (DUF4089)